MESETEKKPLTVEEAKKVICPYALFEGKTFGEMLETEAGYRQLQWFAKEYRGSDFKMKEAAQLLWKAVNKKLLRKLKNKEEACRSCLFRFYKGIFPERLKWYEKKKVYRI